MDQRKKRGLARKVGILGTLAASGALLAGCDVNPPENGFFKLLRFGWPEGITPEATAMGNFWVWTWVVAWIIGIIMWFLMIFSMIAFSAKRAEKAGKGPYPRQTAYNVPLELILTAVPILIVMVLFFFTVQTQDKVTAMDKDPQVKVDVTAYQWNWKFGYDYVSGDVMGGSDYNGRQDDRKQQDTLEGAFDNVEEQKPGPVHGRSQTDLSFLNYDEIETVGTSEEVPVLVLPTNTAIQFDLAAADVVHSFWVPEFLFKRDAFPHPEANKSQRTFQIEKIEQEGAFVGRCAEMCGTYHAMMNFEIRAVSPEKFKQYIEFRKNNPEATNAQALEKIGEAGYATSTSPFLTGRKDTRGDVNTVDLNAK
ncbi:cytochrome c oxidase subunit II [Corynebacterium ulceribovis]|uniref:aa3-type cytochrome oxidase subunit II n=1 Tax=Corynebacterium ulceribovis TaxID=487732 RepID=UPI00036DDD7F|nr:cytochrome c oxidase subunit II [Corynebacterium ulceribovis]